MLFLLSLLLTWERFLTDASLPGLSWTVCMAIGLDRILVIGVERGQVMKLGVLKVVADKIPALLFEVCGKGAARRGPKDETLVAANERIAHMGRLILATLAPPGYVGRSATAVNSS